jgi:hypothetical protein
MQSITTDYDYKLRLPQSQVRTTLDINPNFVNWGFIFAYFQLKNPEYTYKETIHYMDHIIKTTANHRFQLVANSFSSIFIQFSKYINYNHLA